MALLSVVEAPYNAAGDGSTNDTSAIASAVSDASEGDCLVFPRGTYETDTISVPHNKSLTFLGEGTQATRIRTRSNDIDLFHSDRGTGVAEDRFTTQHFYENFTAVLRTSGSDTAPSFNRCTISGAPIGCAAIAYERADLPSSTSNGNDEGWTNTFGVIRNIIFEDNNTTSGGLGSNSAGIYMSGTAYGWTFERLWYHDIDHAISLTAPFIRRCSANASNDRLTYTVDAGQAYPTNAQVTVLQHTGYGSLTAGVSRYTDYFARSPAAGNLQLSTSSGGSAANITSAGSAPIYVAARDGYAGGAISPDGVSIDKITQYGGKTGISIINPENLDIGRYDSYLLRGNLLELRDYRSGSRTYPFNCYVRNVYSESPQTGVLLSTNQKVDPFVYINGRGMNIEQLQIRGETSDTTRPIVHLSGRVIRWTGANLVSSGTQAQPDLWVDGDGCAVYGICHRDAEIYNSGSNNTIEVRDDDAGAPLHSVTSGEPT